MCSDDPVFFIFIDLLLFSFSLISIGRGLAILLIYTWILCIIYFFTISLTLLLLLFSPLYFMWVYFSLLKIIFFLMCAFKTIKFLLITGLAVSYIYSYKIFYFPSYSKYSNFYHDSFLYIHRFFYKWISSFLSIQKFHCSNYNIGL